MKPETRFQNRVLRELKQLPRTWILKTQEKTRKGVPDILLCSSGHFIALELKASEKAIVAPIQRFELGCIQAALGSSFIAYPENWDSVLKAIKSIIKDPIQK